jgi:uncharacterized RDD family membrane protein YckC
MFCTQCGASSDDGARFCRTCGATLPTASATPGASTAATTSTPTSAVGQGSSVGASPSAFADTPTSFPSSAVLPSNLGMSGTAYAQPVVYAGFWLRFAALVVDGILLGIVGVIFGVLIGVAASAQATAIATVLTLAIIAISILYFPIMESSARQATWGKKLVGIMVTDYNGNRISFWRALGRFLGKVISQLIFYIGYIMAAFTERKQALHDIIAGTLVVKGTPNGS